MRYLLSIDGGGIRGLIPALVLLKLEQQLGKPLREFFSFVAGTSTGALQAAAIAAGVPMERIVGIYRDRSREVFKRLPHPLDDAQQAVKGYKYDTQSLQVVLFEEFGAAASWTLNDCPIEVLLTAKQMEDFTPWYFVRDGRHRPNNVTGKLPLIECAVASAAAPTYFDAREIKGLGWMYDGGVGVTGNPVYQLCVEAFCYGDFEPEETRVISLGTGHYEGKRKHPGNMVEVLQWVSRAVLDAPCEQQTELVNRHWPGIMTRLDWMLPRDIDMADAGAIQELNAIGCRNAEATDWEAILRI